MDKLNRMKLLGLALALKRQHAESGQYAGLPFDERFGLLIDEEWTHRENRKLSQRLRNAKLKQQACIEDIDYQHPRGLVRADIKQLARCQWVGKQNVIITGATGVGKSYLACALGNQACRESYGVLYHRVPRLLSDVGTARADGSYRNLMRKLGRADVLILDDWGLAPLGDAERRDLLEVLEERYAHGSLILTSQLPVKSWHGLIGDATLADAILDRIVHHAHRIELKGESMRKSMKNLPKNAKAE